MDAVIAASKAVTASENFRKVLEVHTVVGIPGIYIYNLQDCFIYVCVCVYVRACVHACVYMHVQCNQPLHPQVILAFGNYMNSSKRGGVYGFKLQSLDVVSLQI